MRCILFWHRMVTAQRTPGRGQWMGRLRSCLEAFGCQDYSCATLAGVSGGQLREKLRSVACRRVE